MEFVPAARRQGERGLKPLQHGVNSRDRGGDCLRVGAIQLELVLLVRHAGDDPGVLSGKLPLRTGT